MPSYLEWIRGKVGHTKIIMVYTSACVRDEQGRMLWQKRGDFGFWGLPGGILEADETLPECVVREVREETGLEVQPARLVGIYSSPDFDVTYPNQDQVQQVTFCFECYVNGGQLVADFDETLALAWFAPGEIPQTATWYQAMAADVFASAQAVSFSRGSVGTPPDPNLPYYRLVRPSIGHACYTTAGVSVFATNASGELLLQHRQDNGLWDLPGGMMELGERIDQAAAREALEETGWAVEIEQVIAVYSDEQFIFTFANQDVIRIANVFFRAHCLTQIGLPDADETREIRFFALDDLPELPPFIERMVADARNFSGTARF
jgi:ADP-ribose pyrophosphatase YjhB (NUDIX family)